MASLKHDLEYLAARAGFGLVSLLSARQADLFAVAIGNLAYRILASRRRVAFDNIKRALGGSLGDGDIDVIVRKVFQNVSRSFIETARFGKLKQDGLRKIVVGAGEDYIRQAHERRKGGIILTAHFGNWEMLGAWVTTLGYDMDLVVGVQHNRKMHDLINGCRKEMGSGIIEVTTSSMRQMYKALKANHFLGFAADQHAPARNLELDFFGRKAAVASGPAQLAIRTGCAILPLLLVREQFDRHVVIAGEPIYAPEGGDEQENMVHITKRYLRFWETTISKYPDQWMWTHKRWKI
ncbi:MAG: lysophospholipid acyltransferase family protein [Candidatus Zixiibacteriota bacterium]